MFYVTANYHFTKKRGKAKILDGGQFCLAIPAKDEDEAEQKAADYVANEGYIVGDIDVQTEEDALELGLVKEDFTQLN